MVRSQRNLFPLMRGASGKKVTKGEAEVVTAGTGKVIVPIRLGATVTI